MPKKQEYQSVENILYRSVKVGKIMNVDNDKMIARVRFLDTGMTSDWLQVVINQPYIPDYDVPQRTEYESGGSGDAAFERHKHDVVVKPWMPKINDFVVCIYLPQRNADGFILGKILPWK